MIPFNKPYITGKEGDYINQAILSGRISGDGNFTKKCQQYFQKKYGFDNCLLTTSCTDALEMAAILINIDGDAEVIMPSYTFVSTANAFVLRGAKIVFADSSRNHPNMDVDTLEKLITPKTKAIVPVHYAGAACDMDKLFALAEKYNLYVIEDAAQAIDSYYKGRPLGSYGHLAAFSFHETKNIIAGEGGMLVINDKKLIKRAEIIREKGTNRSAFFRGEVDKYGWVDIGSSFLPSDIIAAFLYAQLEELDEIQAKRKEIWKWYYDSLVGLERMGHIRLPQISAAATNNAHCFYIILDSLSQRQKLMEFLKEENVASAFHYLSLHKSSYYKDKHRGQELKWADFYTDSLLRLPMYYELSEVDVNRIASLINVFFTKE